MRVAMAVGVNVLVNVGIGVVVGWAALGGSIPQTSMPLRYSVTLSQSVNTVLVMSNE